MNGKLSQLWDEARRKKRERMLVSGLVLTIMLLLVALSFVYKLSAEQRVELQTAADSEIQKLKEQNLTLEARVEKLTHAWLRAERLPIEGLWVRNVNGEILATGKIRNQLDEPVGNIPLWVYCLDKDGQVVMKTEEAARSHDGLPLKPGQYREFRIRITDVPAAAKDVVILVGGI